jgi:N-methylhydantoinase B
VSNAQTQQPVLLDPVLVQVIRSALIAAADEMKITLVKTAYNDLLYEVHDFGVVITDAEGNMIAQSDTMPVFLSVLPDCVQAGLRQYGKEGFSEGDVILANDPYTTGTHISDTAVYMPIMVDDELVGFTACMAHWADIGGKAPGGWCADTTDVYQEGVRFNHLKLAVSGEFNETVLAMIWDNVRLPLVSAGDLGAQLAACKTGMRRVQELHRKYGTGTIVRALETVFDQAEAMMRAAIAEIPDGVYTARTLLDHDGVDRTKQIVMNVAVHVEGEAITVDFAGSSPTARGPVNCPFPAVRAGVETAVKGLTLPHDRIVAGHLRPLTVLAPEGTVVHPAFPDPVDSYGYVYHNAAELVLRALAQVIPEKCPAGSYPLFLLYFFHMERERTSESRSISEGSFVYVDPPLGGAGASALRDGADALISLMDGDAPCPVAEMIEAKYPLRLERYELNPASAGKGKFRGGMGTLKDYRVLVDDLYSQVAIEGVTCPGWGLSGGTDAAASAVTIWPDTDREQVIQDKVSFVGPFRAGDRVIATAGGGGGLGDPFERDPAAVREEVWNEFMTVEQALKDYGVVVDPVTLEVEHEATRRERANHTR